MSKLLFFAFITTSFLQHYSLCQNTFLKTYGINAAQGYAVMQTDDNGFFVAGQTGFGYSPTAKSFFGDMYLIRLDSDGEPIWTKTYGDSGLVEECAYSMCKTLDSNFLVCVYSNSVNGLWLWKIDPNGDSVWTKKFNVGKSLFVGRSLFSIKSTADSGFIITGTDGDRNNLDIYLLKLDYNGTEQWVRRYNKAPLDEGYAVIQTSDSGFAVCGQSKSDLFVMRTDSKGDTLWTKQYGFSETDIGTGICESKDDGFLVSGTYGESGESGIEMHIWLLRINALGDTLWTKKINSGFTGDYAYASQKTSDGGCIVVGEVTTNANFDTDILLIKLDADGNIQWKKTIGGLANTNFRGNDVKETTDGGYIITGYKKTWVGWADYTYLSVVKVNSSGEITSIKQEQVNVNPNFLLMQNFPNPFNPTTTISYSIPQASHVSLTVYDMLGREVRKLVSEFKSTGNYTAQFNASGLASGMYIYRLTADNFTAEKKLVILK